ncbi:MAG: hypothetical protein Q4Q04_05835, partial [Methanocorpusculum sp.]|nr:hypothetical protein [Methanocorpusculum sp.]
VKGGGNNIAGSVSSSRIFNIKFNSATNCGGGAYIENGATFPLDSGVDYADNTAGQSGTENIYREP